MHTVNFLTNLVEHHQVWAYAIIFLGLIFEGEVILITTGVLAHLGAVNFNFALIFILAGGIIKTLLGYYVGKHIHHRWHKTKFVQYLEHRVGDVMPNFERKPFWSIFISKFIIGVNHFVILFSGYKKIHFKTYLKAEFISTAIWAPLLLSLGYFFSYTALGVSRDIWRFLFIVACFVIGFIVFDKILAFIYRVFQESHDNDE
ncbi:MAG: DedA family protein [bacterium]|nr:DedA family protein [bacterium]